MAVALPLPEMSAHETERFWSNVDRRGPDECWEWSSHRSRGYGVFTTAGRKYKAHRLAWRFTHGPIPDGLLACHKCDNPPCCNPSHLFLGTDGDNTRDRDAKGRQRSIGRPGTRNERAKLTESHVTELRRQCISGCTFRSLAVAFGISERRVREIYSGYAWPHTYEQDMRALAPDGVPARSRHYHSGSSHHSQTKPECIARGSRAGAAVLHESMIPVIRAARGKRTAPEVAADYGTTPSAIYSIWYGRTWRHVS